VPLTSLNSIPDLVKTLSALAAVSPVVRVLVSLKRRHLSEVIFFDLLDSAGFMEEYHTSIELPDRSRIAFGQSLESVEVYVYKQQTRIDTE